MNTPWEFDGANGGEEGYLPKVPGKGHFRGSVDYYVETRFGHDIYLYIVTNMVDKC